MSRLISAALYTMGVVVLAACGPDANPAQPAVDAAFAKGGSSNGSSTSRETKLEGTVTAVGTSSVTIGSRVVLVDANTKIERNDLHVSLSAIKVGDRGQARIAAGATVAYKVESTGN
ncbi:MAG: hypothetical protein KA154_02155 [Gemmatimonadaceae bacterium]|nr:hypothetical protein [Gemmatimonadaceae bacterium]MCC6431485.1 hypothetical protein [Gemmatimonadaceae bacterium]